MILYWQSNTITPHWMGFVQEHGFDGTWNSYPIATFDSDSKPKCPLKWLQCRNNFVDNA